MTNSEKETAQRQSAKRYLECILDACQVSPIVTYSIPKKQKKVHAKQKIQKVVQTLEDTFNIPFVKICVTIKIKLNFQHLELNS